MNYKIKLLKTLLILGIMIQTSCKQKDDQNTTETSESKPVSVVIDKNYQQDEKLVNGEKLQVKSVIRFSTKYNSSKLWQYDLNMKQGHLYSFHELEKGNVLFIIEEGDGDHNFTPFLLVLDKEGNQIAKQKIATDKKSKYNFYNALVSKDNQGGFTLYVKKEINSLNNSDGDTDEARMRNTLAKYQIEKMNFSNKYSNYQDKTTPIADLLLRPLLDKGFSYIRKGDFSLQYLNGKVFVSGTAARPNQDEVPFIAVLDSNLKLLKLNSFDNYPQTEVNNISLNDGGKYFIEGVEESAADGTYYSTNKRFVVDENLNLISDKSDDKPYYSFYRGPSAPEYEEEDSATEDVQAESAPSESSEPSKESETDNRVIFFTDRTDNSYYGLREKKINSSEIVLEKNKSSDSTALWQTRFVFPDTYEVPYSNSSEGFKRSNGDFVFFLFLRDKAVENDVLSVAIFVFNKEGRLLRQFQTPGYFGLTEFKMKESEGKLVTAFISSEAKFVNNEWEYPSAFRSIIYPLD